jgi:site-specific DNA-methyltransferase (adenine-specific)
VYYGRYKVIPIRTEIIRFCETVGFDYMGAVIWQKVTTCNTTGGGAVMGSFPYPRNGILKLDYEFILLFKKGGKPRKVSRERKEISKMTTEEWNRYFSGHWNFAGEKQGKHLAMFPEELPRRLIKMFTYVGETVIDPFLGSGTTTLAAKNLGRSSIGYEINRDFIPIIKERTGMDESNLFGNGAEFELITPSCNSIDYSSDLAKLPYIFTDPIKFDKKIDPRKLQYGSKINQESTDRDDYYTVKEIINPEMVELSSGLTVRLIGVKKNVITEEKAVKFLYDKAKGQRVFVRYDEQKYDSNDTLCCYLYLKNKTFVNAHLIKSGLVDVDKDFSYKFRDKFIRLSGVSNG